MLFVYMCIDKKKVQVIYSKPGLLEIEDVIEDCQLTQFFLRISSVLLQFFSLTLQNSDLYHKLRPNAYHLMKKLC